MKRSLASTVASAIRREFRNIQHRVQLHERGMELIDAQIRGVSQDYWIIIDYEDFLIRPLEYAPILGKWFHIENVDALMHGLGEVKVRSLERNVLAESWQIIREWDKENFQHHLNDNFTMEYQVQNIMQKLDETERSMWNNGCVVVRPESMKFIENGFKCF